MAYTPTHNSDFHAARPGFLTRFRASAAEMFSLWMDARSRIDQFEKLQAKSDADLAAMGLRREDIVTHVFRDRVGS